MTNVEQHIAKHGKKIDILLQYIEGGIHESLIHSHIVSMIRTEAIERTKRNKSGSKSQETRCQLKLIAADDAAPYFSTLH